MPSLPSAVHRRMHRYRPTSPSNSPASIHFFTAPRNRDVIGAVDVAVIVRQREVAHRADPDDVVALRSWMTIGRFTMAPVPRMPDCGGTKIGVSKSAPTEPVLVTVNVPPESSSRPDLVVAGALREVGDLPRNPGDVEVVGVLDDGHDQTARRVHGDAEVDLAVVSDLLEVLATARSSRRGTP